MAKRGAAPFILRLAFRNLWRHRRRTGLTIGALAFGIALMVLGQAWTDAMERAVVDPAKNATLGHVHLRLQVVRRVRGPAMRHRQPPVRSMRQ